MPDLTNFTLTTKQFLISEIKGLGSSVAALNAKVSVSVTDPVYGALGDGITNDAPAINAAIVAVNAAGGGTVLFPPAVGGFYSVDSVISLLPGVFLQGATSPGYMDSWDAATSMVLAGSASRIKASTRFTPNNDGSNASAVVACSTISDRGHGFGVRDMVLDAAGQASYAIILNTGVYYERRLYLNNSAFIRAGNSCFTMNNAIVEATNCHFFASSNWGISGSISDSFFVGCYVHSNNSGGYFFQDGAGAFIVGGKIEECFAPGVIVGTGGGNARINIQNVWFQHNTMSAVKVSGTGHPIAFLNGCMMDSNGYANTLGNGAQLHADGAGRIVADACQFSVASAATPYYFGVTTGGKIWHRNSIYLEPASNATVYNDTTGTVTVDGGLISSLA